MNPTQFEIDMLSEGLEHDELAKYALKHVYRCKKLKKALEELIFFEDSISPSWEDTVHLMADIARKAIKDT